jgi:hypothetical protein
MVDGVAAVPILLSVIITTYCLATVGTVYVANADHTVDVYRIIGDLEYDLQNGTVLIVESPAGGFETVVVNNTEEVIVIEEIVYSCRDPRIPHAVFDMMPDAPTSYQPERDYFAVSPQSCQQIVFRRGKIDYFFDEEIPDVIEKPGKSSSIKYWLHEEY